jgi:hypothetical protein
MPGA